MKVKSVVELPCGAINDSQMQIGDQLQISSVTEPVPAA
jgi:uncharacterized membrane protein (UPF0127 family)